MTLHIAMQQFIHLTYSIILWIYNKLFLHSKLDWYLDVFQTCYVNSATTDIIVYVFYCTCSRVYPVKHLAAWCLGHRLFGCYAFSLLLTSGHVSTENHLRILTPYIWHNLRTYAGHLVVAFSTSVLPFIHQQFPNFPLISSLIFHF